MLVHLPIAEMSVNVLVILGTGILVGFLSGLFGVGGGFLMTPLLLFIGVPAAVAVASQANQTIGTSISGVLAHWWRGNVDVKMGLALLAGGLVGSSFGVWLFAWLQSRGQVDLVIKAAYVVFLGVVGVLMLVESGRAILRRRRRIPLRRHHHTWVHGLPFKIRFRHSRLYISVMPPVAIGIAVGVLTAIMGVSGGILMVPAMIYFLGMPTSVVVGTSLFQIIFVTANVTVLQAIRTQTVDVVLAMLLMIGGVVGAQIGARVGSHLRGEYLRGLLAVLVLVICAMVAHGLVAVPQDLYSLGPAASP